MLEQPDLGEVPHHCGEAAHQHRTSAVAVGVEDARAGMRRLEAEPETAIFGAVERRAERQQLADALGSLVHEDLDRFRVGEAVAGGEGVLGVLGWRVTRPDRDGNTALGPGCRAVGKRALG